MTRYTRRQNVVVDLSGTSSRNVGEGHPKLLNGIRQVGVIQGELKGMKVLNRSSQVPSSAAIVHIPRSWLNKS